MLTPPHGLFGVTVDLLVQIANMDLVTQVIDIIVNITSCGIGFMNTLHSNSGGS